MKPCQLNKALKDKTINKSLQAIKFNYFETLLFCALILLSKNLIAQNTYPTGLLEEDARYDTMQRISVHSHSKAVLPNKVDLKPYCPRVKNQGEIYSCVGWAMGYGAMSIDAAIDKHWKDEKIITEQAYSALFIYNHIKAGESCKRGSRISEAIRFLQEKGNLKAKEFDFNLNDCSKKALDFQWQKAKPNRITDYETLFDRNASPAIKIQQIKRALAGQLTTTRKPKPVIIGMSVRQNFYQLRNARYWWPDKGNSSPAGGHAMVVVGYDDELGAFRLFNSWGKSWGNLGFIWVKYKDFIRFCKYAYMLRMASDETYVSRNRSNLALNIHKKPQQNPSLHRKPQPSTPRRPNRPSNTPTTTHSKPRKPNPSNQPAIQYRPNQAPQTENRPLRALTGRFEFRSFEGFDGRSPIFKEAAVQKKGATYELVKKDWAVGDGFQLWLTTELNHAYLYVFSIDSEHKVQVHWPRKEKFNPKFSNMNESAYVLNHAKVRIPGQNKKGNQTVLYLENPGTDQLVVLFSTKKIRNFKSIYKKLQYRSSNLAEDLVQLLGNHAIPAADIDYDYDKMRFEVSTRSIGYIVPLVLKVEAK